ncbi:MAG: thiamine pyrophosphate-dependent enzyme, partial [Calditrichia bacterium]
HSSSDDHAKYRSKSELERDRKRDPINIFMKTCVKAKIITRKEFEAINEEVIRLVDKTTDWVLQQPDP